MYWTEGAVICGLGIVGWYSAILALRNHAIGYVIQGLLTSLICLAASVVVMVASVQSMDNAEFYLRLLIPLSIAVTSFRIALKGLGWARSGYRRMKAEKANLLLPENKVAEPSIDSSVTDQVKVHHA
ncbi:MAG: hypothetical protein HONBIEJF_01003 [Fimbriimonadaceae bacterium]|nr:hypothetical protein [Fimbriimonadaceae bacterium]